MNSTTRLPHGLERRAKIVSAAITVIADQGLETMSHRRVAAAAGVPVAATTYYFASLDELRRAALAEIVRRDLEAMEKRFERLPAEGPLGALLAQLIWDWLENREASIVTVETFASAARRDSIRDIADDWANAWIGALEPRVGLVRARAAVYAAFGCIQHALVGPQPLSLDETTALMRQTLGEPHPADHRP